MQEPTKLHKPFWEFADVTVIHGFGYASKAFHWCETLLWLIAVALCVGLAVNDLIDLVTTYQSQPTTTNINVYYNATSSMTLTNPVICIDAMLECLNLPSDFSAASDEIFTAFAVEPNTFNLSSLSSSALATVIRMFSLIAAMEDISFDHNYAGLPPIDYPPANLFEIYYAPMGSYLDYTTLEPLYILRKILSEVNFNFTELTWQVGEYLCQQFTPFAMHGPGGSFTGTCSRANITWVGSGATRTEVCVRLSSTFFTFPSSGATRVIGVCNSGLYGGAPWGAICNIPPLHNSGVAPLQANSTGSSATSPTANNQSASIGVYNTTCVQSTVATSGLTQPFLYFDPGGERRYSSASPDWVSGIVPGFKATTSVAVGATYDAVSTRKFPCITNDTVTECSLRCKQAFFMNNCGCYPISLFTLAYTKPTSMPYCVNLDLGPPVQNFQTGSIENVSFSACMSVNFIAKNPILPCLSKCIHECKTTTFTVETSTVGSPPGQFIVENTVIISRWQYPNFEQSLSMSASSFFATFGGSLGIWLGASFISMVHVPVYLFTAFLKACQEKKKTTTSADAGLRPPVGEVPPMYAF